jgi:predicted DNA-binding transcriptional regulator AlpA
MTQNTHSADTADRVIRSAECLGLTGLTASARDREVRAGRFPRPFTLIPGGRAVGWSWREVQHWIAERKAAAEAARGAA